MTIVGGILLLLFSSSLLFSSFPSLLAFFAEQNENPLISSFLLYFNGETRVYKLFSIENSFMHLFTLEDKRAFYNGLVPEIEHLLGLIRKVSNKESDNRK